MTYYEILEVSENASEEVIKMAYKALCRKYHPDVYSGDEKIANDMMSLINEAYDVLSDASKRQEYDEFLRLQRVGASSNEQEHFIKEPGNSWFRFYRIAIIIGGIMSLVRTTISIININEFESFSQMASIYVFAAIVELAIGILWIYTGYGMIRLLKKSYYTNLFLLIISPFIIGFSLLGTEDFNLQLALSVTYAALNIYYFRRRKFMFGIEELQNFKIKKCLVPICLMIAMSVSIFFVPMLFENTESKDYTEISYTSSEDITKNFNKLAQHYGYNDWVEMVEYLNEEYNDDLSTNISSWITYERIATEYLGLDSYDYAKGKINPYRNEEIKTFGDYQTYVYRCVIEAEEYDSWYDTALENAKKLDEEQRQKMYEELKNQE